MKLYLQIAIILSSMVFLSYGDCVMTQLSPSTPPQPALNTTPLNYYQNWTNGTACPEFNNTASCCNDVQNNNLLGNFQLLASNFGHQGGGCDFCEVNLVRFWCYFTCSPNQTDFLRLGNEQNVTPVGSTSPILVREVYINISSELACGVYESCSKVPLITEIPSAQSGFGIFNFLGTNGEAQGLVYINVNLTSDTNQTMDFTTPPYECNATNTTDPFGYNISQPCQCSSCLACCVPAPLITYGQISDGFSGTGVLIIYLIAILLTIFIVVWRVFNKKQRSSPRGIADTQRPLVKAD